MPKPDYGIRNFSWVMRREIGLFAFSICMGFFFLPWYWNGVLRSARNDELRRNGQSP